MRVATAGAAAAPAGAQVQPRAARPREQRCVEGSIAVYVSSDLHTDHAANLAFIEGLRAPPRGRCRTNVLIVAGDISHELHLIRRSLEALRSRWDRVLFVSGNHEAWVTRGRPETQGGAKDSAEKLKLVDELCASLGVDTAPVRLGRLWIVPVVSWHHKDWDTEPDIEGVPRASKLTIADYAACRWPQSVPGGDADGSRGVAEWADGLNEEPGTERAAAWRELWSCLAAARGSSGGGGGDREGGSSGGNDSSGRQDFDVLSFSHFLPHQALLPEKRFLTYPPLAKAVGSDPLAARLRRLRPQCHVFGHSHFAWDAEVDGTRYVQAPLCYPAERQRRGRSIRVSDASAVWRRQQEVAAAHDSSSGGGGLEDGALPLGEGGAGGTSGEREEGEGTAAAAAEEAGTSAPPASDLELPVLLYVARYRRAAAAAGSGAAVAGAEPVSGLDGSSSGGGGGGGSDAEDGFLEWVPEWSPCLEGLWSEHYRDHPREPWVTTLAPWVAPRFERRRQRLEAAGGGVSAGGSLAGTPLGTETEAD